MVSVGLLSYSMVVAVVVHIRDPYIVVLVVVVDCTNTDRMVD